MITEIRETGQPAPRQVELCKAQDLTLSESE
jgi:hypothetical protein